MEYIGSDKTELAKVKYSIYRLAQNNEIMAFGINEKFKEVKWFTTKSIMFNVSLSGMYC